MLRVFQALYYCLGKTPTFQRDQQWLKSLGTSEHRCSLVPRLRQAWKSAFVKGLYSKLEQVRGSAFTPVAATGASPGRSRTWIVLEYGTNNHLLGCAREVSAGGWCWGHQPSSRGIRRHSQWGIDMKGIFLVAKHYSWQYDRRANPINEFRESL